MVLPLPRRIGPGLPTADPVYGLFGLADVDSHARMELITASGAQLRCCRQRGTDQFSFVAREDVAVGVGRWGPHYIPAIERMDSIQQMSTAEFLITIETQPDTDQIPLVGEEQDRIFVRSEMHAGAVFQGGHGVR